MEIDPDAVWQEVDKDLYERAWQSREGDLLYVVDRVVLGGTKQSGITDHFEKPRYELRYNWRFRNAPELYEEIDRFETVEEAEEYVFEEILENSGE